MFIDKTTGGSESTARQQQAQLHAHDPVGSVPASQCVLVSDDVRLQDAIVDKNPINRYFSNSPMLLNIEMDTGRGRTLCIQKDSPGADKESDWLPAPDGPIYLIMRLYWPKTEPPSILPPGEGTWKPLGLVKVK